MDSIALSVLQNFFGDYVEGIDSKNLVADLSGIEVKNLKLKKSALEGLELPIEVKEGMLQRVSLKLPPLTELTKKSAVVLVEKLYILASPKYRTTDTQADMIARKQLSKIKLLEIGEILAKNAINSLDEKPKKEEDVGWLDAKIAIVIGNIQVTVKELHLRYEDSVSYPSNPFVFGITLEEITYQAVNDKWEIQFFEKIGDITYKLTQVKNLAVYLCNQPAFQWNSVSELEQLMSLYSSEKDRIQQQPPTSQQPSISQQPLTPQKTQPQPQQQPSQIQQQMPLIQPQQVIQPQVQALPTLPQNLPQNISLNSNINAQTNLPNISQNPQNLIQNLPLSPQNLPVLSPTNTPLINPSNPLSQLPQSLPSTPQKLPTKPQYLPPPVPTSNQQHPLQNNPNNINVNNPINQSVQIQSSPKKPSLSSSNDKVVNNNSSNNKSNTNSPSKQQQQLSTQKQSSTKSTSQSQQVSKRKNTSYEHKKLKDLVWDTKFKKFGEYILTPISGTFRNRYDMAKKFNFFSPKTTTEAIISEVRIKIDASQYLSIQKFLQWSREYNIRLEFVSLYDHRPTELPSVSKESALKWWSYIIRCGILRVQESRLQWSGDIQKEKDSYSNIYQKVVKQEKLRPQEQDLITYYEKKYNLQQLSWFRRWTHAKILVEKRENPTFFSSWFSSSGSKDKEKNQTEEQKMKLKNKQIFEVIDSANKLQPTNYPEDYIQTIIRVLWAKLSIEIFDKDFKNLMCGSMHNLDFNINLRTDLNSTLQQWFGEGNTESETSIEDIEWKRAKSIAKESLQLKLTEKEQKFEIDLQKRYEVMLQQFQEKVEREMDIYRKKVQNDIDQPQSDWITLNLGGESFKTKLSVLLRDSSFFQLVFSELIEMQDREKLNHNRMISSESTIQGIKSEKETLEVVVAELSKQLKKEREKRMKLEEDMAVLKSQMNAILKSLQS